MVLNAVGTLLISDLDGTLLRDDKSVSKNNLDFLNKWVRCGGYFTIATGRNVQSASHRIMDLPINCPCVLLNGCAIYDYPSSNFLYLYYLDNYIDIVRFVFQKYPQAGIEVFSKDLIYVVNQNEVTKNHLAKESLAFEEKTLSELPAKGVIKILVGLKDKDLKEVKDCIDALLPQTLCSVQTDENYIEILPKHINKATAIKKLKGMYDIQHVIAFGDFYNDIEMIKTADIGYVMANAPNELKSMFKNIASSNNDDGICNTLKGLASLGKIKMKGWVI